MRNFDEDITFTLRNFDKTSTKGVGKMSKENDEIDFWDVLTTEEKQRQILLLGAFIVFLLPWIGAKGISLLGLIAIFFSTRKPGRTSFMVFFQKWFKEQMFPQLSEKLKIELDERSKQANASFFDSLKDSAQALLLSKTTGIRAELAWTAFASTVRPAYRNFYAFRIASVQMGTDDNPVFAVFIGFNGDWFLSPFMKLDFEDVSVLSMWENRH